jgi:hypothetical protein
LLRGPKAAVKWRIAVRRVIYKRMTEGDQLKLLTKSATSGTGGGARDLRFGPWRGFEPIVARMLPDTKVERSRRKKGVKWVPVDVEVRVGSLNWNEGADRKSAEMEFWPPTSARSLEGRIATAYRLPPLARKSMPSGQDEVFALVWDDENGIWAQYVAEPQLRNPRSGQAWEPTIRAAILQALDEALQIEAARRKKGRPQSVRGWIDLTREEGESFIGVQR